MKKGVRRKVRRRYAACAAVFKVGVYVEGRQEMKVYSVGLACRLEYR